MEEEKKILLTDFLELCLDFKDDPSATNEKKIKDLASQFLIREYIPLAEKNGRVALIMGCIPSDELNALVAESWLAQGKILYGALGYIYNLENNLDKLSMTPAVVDLLFEFGVIDLIMSKCEKDYRRLEKMLDETINFTNLFRLVETTTLYSKDSIDSFTQAIQEMKADLTPEMLADLKSLAAAGSPEFEALKQTVVDEVLGAVMEKDLKPIPENVRAKEMEHEADLLKDEEESGEEEIKEDEANA